MKMSIGREETNKETAVTLLQQRIRACRLCQEHGYIREAHPITSGRGNDRVMVIGHPGPSCAYRTHERPFSKCRVPVLHRLDASSPAPARAAR